MRIPGTTITQVQGVFTDVLANLSKIDDLLRPGAYSTRTAERVITLATEASRGAREGQRLLAESMRSTAWHRLPNSGFLSLDLQLARHGAGQVADAMADTAASMRSGDWARRSDVLKAMERSQGVIEHLELERVALPAWP